MRWSPTWPSRLGLASLLVALFAACEETGGFQLTTGRLLIEPARVDFEASPLGSVPLERTVAVQNLGNAALDL